jgi:hypothetical protein
VADLAAGNNRKGGKKTKQMQMQWQKQQSNSKRREQNAGSGGSNSDKGLDKSGERGSKMQREDHRGKSANGWEPCNTGLGAKRII